MTGSARIGVPEPGPGTRNADVIRSDAEFITLARTGDREAFGGLYERHVAAATALSRRLTNGGPAADDIVSDAFARVLRVLDRGGGPDVAFRPYLLATVRTVAVDHFRKTGRELPSEHDDLDLRLIEHDGVLDLNATSDIEVAVNVAFESLPERWRLVLWHCELEGAAPGEVADLLGMNPNAVSALLYRARTGLRTAFVKARAEATAGQCHELAIRLQNDEPDALSNAERAEIEAHLIGCDACRDMFARGADVTVAMHSIVGPALLGVGVPGYLLAKAGAGTSIAIAGASTGATAGAGGAVAAPKPTVARNVTMGAVVAAAIVAGGVGVASRGSSPAPVVPTTALATAPASAPASIPSPGTATITTSTPTTPTPILPSSTTSSESVTTTAPPSTTSLPPPIPTTSSPATIEPPPIVTVPVFSLRADLLESHVGPIYDLGRPGSPALRWSLTSANAGALVVRVSGWADGSPTGFQRISESGQADLCPSDLVGTSCNAPSGSYLYTVTVFSANGTVLAGRNFTLRIS